jgi:hypothetical protein
MTRHTFGVALMVWLVSAPAGAQVIWMPTPAPEVTAVGTGWFERKDPIFFAGDWYYPTGPDVYFDGQTMVPSGSNDGVTLYTKTTIEAYSMLFVPAGRGLMRPYERPRTGRLAGTTGSRVPSFPVHVVPRPFDPSRRFAAAVPGEASDALEASTASIGALGEGEAVSGTFGDVQPVEIVRRPTNNVGVWIRYEGQRWTVSGEAVPMEHQVFVEVGRYNGFPVYRRPGADPGLIFVRSRSGDEPPSGLLTPYRLMR